VSRLGAVSSSDTRVVPRVPLVQGLPLPPPDGRVVVAGLVPAGVVAQRSGKQVGEDREDHRHLLPLRAPVHVEEARPPFDLVVVELVQRIVNVREVCRDPVQYIPCRGRCRVSPSHWVAGTRELHSRTPSCSPCGRARSCPWGDV
jgi:hypothetical protein